MELDGLLENERDEMQEEERTLNDKNDDGADFPMFTNCKYGGNCPFKILEKCHKPADDFLVIENGWCMDAWKDYCSENEEKKNG